MIAEHNRVMFDSEVQLVRQEPKAKKKKSAPVILGLIVLIVIITASIAGSFRWKDTLQIKRVFVEGNRIVPATEVVRLGKITSGMVMYGIDLDVVRKDILSQVYIKSVDVLRELPDALRILVQEREPIVGISIDRVMFLDEEGILLPPYESATMFDVPLITGFEKTSQWSVGERIESPVILRALALLKDARAANQDVNHLISEVRIEPNGDFVLYSLDGGVKIIVGKGNEIRKLQIFRTFWHQVVHQRGADQLRLVDLRFEDQVIARWKHDAKLQSAAFY